MQPTGFTPLTQDYTPLQLSASATYHPSQGVISNLPIAETPTLVPPAASDEYLLSCSGLVAAANLPFDVSVQVKSGLPGVGVVTRVFSTDPSTAIINSTAQAPLAITNNLGVGTTQLLFTDWVQDATVWLVAYPIQPSEALRPINFLISPAELSSILIKSNSLTIKVIVNTTQPLSLLSATQASQPIPFQDAAVSALNSLLDQYYSAEAVNQSVTQTGPLGSGGNSIYSALKALNPELLSPFHTADIAIKSLQGATQSLVSRVSSWSADLLHDTHSVEGGAQTEVTVVKAQLSTLGALMPGIPFSTMTAGYSSFISESGKLQATAAEKQLADYAYGNSVVRTNAVRQYDVDQLRVQAGSVTSINTPTLNFASQQHITQARFNHIQADIQQQAHISLWVRAEDLLTLMGTNVVRHNLNSLTEVSANTTQLAGGSVNYADSTWNQVGQLSTNKLHPTRSVTPAGSSYGKAINVSIQDYNISSRQGGVNLNGSNRITLSAPVVFINSSGYTNTALTMPKVFSAMVDPKPYPKSEAADPQGKVQINNETPEAPIEPGGPDLGQYTSSLGGNLPLSLMNNYSSVVSQEDY